MEKLLGMIEGYAAPYIDCLDKTKYNPVISQSEINYLRLFTLIQYGRTPQYARISKTIVESLFNELAEELTKERHSDPSKGSVEKTEYGNNTSIHIETIMRSHPIAIDLDFTLIVNDADLEFVTSDNPVVMYNQLYSSNATGISSKGLQIFFPISPRCAVYFYDSSTYKVRQDNNCSTITIHNRDIAELNALQYCAATNNLYFNNDAFNMNALRRKANVHRKQYLNRISKYSVAKGRRDSKVLLFSVPPDFKVSMKLSFSSLRKSAKALRKEVISGNVAREFISRDPTLARLCKEFDELQIAGKYGMLDFHKFLTEREMYHQQTFEN